MKTLSLKLDDVVFEETEQLLQKIKKPRNRYINEALQYYNRLQRNQLLADILATESKLVSEDSMQVLNEFEALEDDRS
jgi:predicted transcriptional regulator